MTVFRFEYGMELIIAGTVVGGRLASSMDLLDLIWQASWLVQLVILLLVAASIISWAAIAFKWRELAGAEQDSEGFLEAYRDSWESAYEAARELDRSPLSAIFLSVYKEMKRMTKYGGRSADDRLDDAQLHTLSKQIAWTAAQEQVRLETRLSFLATTGSAAPFVGLFGTVVGIINAFTGIGSAGSASLAVVAPGIAEALIVTAVGLFAAIPATIFYNVFVAHLREIAKAVDLFASELEGDLQRGAGPSSRSSGAVRVAEA